MIRSTVQNYGSERELHKGWLPAWPDREYQQRRARRTVGRRRLRLLGLAALIALVCCAFFLVRFVPTFNYALFRRKVSTNGDALRAVWLGDSDTLPRGPQREYFRCVRSLARLMYLCRLIDNPHQLAGTDPPLTLPACEELENALYERCAEARQAPSRTVPSQTALALRTLPYFVVASAPALDTLKLENVLGPQKIQRSHRALTEINVSLVTHASLSKLPELRRLTESWPAPISCALVLPDVSQSHQVLDMYPKGRSDRVDIHLLLADDYERPTYYPFNAARNLALDNARTDWVFLVDVDFVPSPNLVESVQRTLRRFPELREEMQQRRAVLIVPAFEKLQAREEHQTSLPATRAELVAETRAGRIVPFHVSWYWPGHGPTDYIRWLADANETSEHEPHKPYRVRYRDGYEPYIVAYRHGLPRYEDSFVGYGWNKQSFIKELHYAGYRMYVLRDGFIIHMNHEYASWRNQQKHENLRALKSARAYHEQLLRTRYGKSVSFEERSTS